TLACYVSIVVYNLYFHPLAAFPGPRLAAATPWWMMSSYLGGRTPRDLLELHNRYGPVVRTAPGAPSYIGATQWKEIYGHKAPGQPEFSKDRKYFAELEAFGESFECLTTSTLHTWIEIFFSLARFMSFHQVTSRLPGPIRLPATLWTMPKTIASDVQTLKQLQSVVTQQEKVKHRLRTEAAVPDFMGKLVAAYNDGKMSYGQLEGNSQILIAAGSETTAT
ncbi:Cytochrome P450 monooxygenase hmp1, partial [Colletotrichum shisoi]